MTGAQIDCAGPCKSMYHSDCVGVVDPAGQVSEFRCEECTTGNHVCCVCSKEGAESGEFPKKCGSANCGKFFHDECAKHHARFRQDGQVSANVSSYICSSHSCLTCWLDLQAGLVDEKQPLRGQFVSCVRCPKTYHVGDFCIPAGSVTLDW